MSDAMEALDMLEDDARYIGRADVAVAVYEAMMAFSRANSMTTLIPMGFIGDVLERFLDLPRHLR